jgi:hypothetical protein
MQGHLPLEGALRACFTASLRVRAFLQLWRFTCQGDSSWWQRVVGLVQQHTPHPDSWRSLISSYCSTSNSTTYGSSYSGTIAERAQEVQQLHALLHGNASRVRTSPSVAGKQVPGSGGVAAAAGQGPHRAVASRLSGFVVQPLQLDGDTGHGSSSADAARQRSSPAVTQARSAFAAAAAAASCEEGRLPSEGSEAAASTASTAAAAAAASWPSQWAAEDVAWLSQLVQAEELLETAVHSLLGVGADSSGELYDKLRAMTRGQGLALEVRSLAATSLFLGMI